MINALPVLVKLRELLQTRVGQSVVLAGWAELGFSPLILNELLAAQLAEQRLQGSFLRGELGAGQTFQNIGNVDLVPANDA